MTATGRTIDVSVNSRGFTPWQKQALIVEARGRCDTKGCDAPFSWLHADHGKPAFAPQAPQTLSELNHRRSRHACPTIMGNGAMKCEPDNLAKGNRIKPSDKSDAGGDADEQAADDKAA